MLIRAHTVLTMTGEPLSPGCVRVEDSKITACEKYLEPLEGEEVIDLAEHVLMPGMINAHCHLEYTGMLGKIAKPQSFTEWLQHIIALKSHFKEEEYVNGVRKGFELLKKSGCTTVLNISTLPDLMSKISRPLLRTWWFLECMDVREKQNVPSMIENVLEIFEKNKWIGGVGFSPHAPYTSSLDLYKRISALARDRHFLCTTHVAESSDENNMFLNHRGVLHDFLKQVGRDMEDGKKFSSFAHLARHKIFDSTWLLAHMNELEELDFDLLRQNPLPVVHCPKCHDYFGHKRFPLEELQRCGCLICLGTDSLASNDSLDLRAEIRQAKKIYPQVSDEEWIRMVTVNSAKYLNHEKTLGCIHAGAYADLVAFRMKSGDPWKSIIQSEEPPAFFMVNGRVLSN